MPSIRRIPRLLFGLVLLAMLAACATGPRVSTELDPEADFSSYRTWGFYEPLAMEESGYSSYLTERIKSSVRREMDARGYRFVANGPDLRVNFQGVIRDRTSVYTVPRSDIQYFYSYRARRYVGVPVWYDETQVNQYTEGTLSVDLVDAARNHLVWTGAAMGRVNQRASPQEQAAQADEAIAAIFERYPHGIGRGETLPVP